MAGKSCRCLLLFTLVAIGLGSVTTYAGNNPAGVKIDADGVLRKKEYDDPGGALTLKRIREAKIKLPPDLARLSKLRKISLNRLEKAIAARLAAGEFETDDMKYLAGLTQIQYVFFYPESNDIVIAGPAEGYVVDLADRVIGIHSGSSVLELQDLVVALRAFPPSRERTPLISVSIDPTREGLARMQHFLANLGRITPRDAERIAIGLRESLGMQNVSVNGISAETHFAQVLVEADYRMKLIGIGLERPEVNIRSYVSRANPRDVARNAMLRWFFVPNYERLRVSDDEFAMELVGEGVKLSGVDEVVNTDGVRVEGRRTDRAAQAFVQEFTKKYPALAVAEPIYAQLRNLMDMAITAAFIQEQDYYGQADWHLGVLADESQFPVETYTAPKHVESAVNVYWKRSTLMTPIGGGVNIQPRQALNPERILSDEGGKLSDTRKGLKVEGLADGQWWWD